jgi:hypothetical protein
MPHPRRSMALFPFASLPAVGAPPGPVVALHDMDALSVTELVDLADAAAVSTSAAR